MAETIGQLGIDCLINNNNSYTAYKADLIDKSITSGTWTRNLTNLLGPFKFQSGYEKYAVGSMTLKFYVGSSASGYSRLQCDRDTNAFLNAIHSAVLTFGDEPFEYPVEVTSQTVKYTDVPYFNLVTLNLACCKRLHLETLSSGSNEYIALTNWGAIDVNCLVSCTLSSNTFQMTDNYPTTIKATNLTSGQVFKIDGIDTGGVTMGTTNVFANTTMIRFPIVKSGYNEIYFSQSGITLQYYPTFYI